jgi:hypothetical protein
VMPQTAAAIGKIDALSIISIKYRFHW